MRFKQTVSHSGKMLSTPVDLGCNITTGIRPVSIMSISLSVSWSLLYLEYKGQKI